MTKKDYSSEALPLIRNIEDVLGFDWDTEKNYFKNITSLSLDRYGDIEDLAPLKEFPNLVYLNLSSNNIIDITPLQSLNKIVTLNLSNNSLFDIKGLENMKSLKNLILYNNPISEIPKELLSKLDFIDVNQTLLKNKDFLENCNRVSILKYIERKSK